MTDNDIKKALECCLAIEGIHCDSCPVKGDCISDSGINILHKYALDLINRQQAEIVRLKAEADMADGYEEALIQTAKTEAIKEFAKMFEKKIKDVRFTLGQTWEIKCALKQTLQEMTESVNYGSSKTEE